MRWPGTVVEARDAGGLAEVHDVGGGGELAGVATVALALEETGLGQTAQRPRRRVLADTEIGGDAPHVGGRHQVVPLGTGVEGDVFEDGPGSSSETAANLPRLGRDNEHERWRSPVARRARRAHAPVAPVGSRTGGPGGLAADVEEAEQAGPGNSQAAAQTHHGQTLSLTALQPLSGQGVGRASADAKHPGCLLDGEDVGQLVDRRG